MLNEEELFRTGDLADLEVGWERPGLAMWMLVRRILRGKCKQESHLDQQSPGYGKIEKEKNPEKEGGREKGSVRNLESDPMTGQGTVNIGRIGTIEIGIEPGTRRRRKIVVVTVIVIVIGRVIAIEVGTVVVSMRERGTVSALEIRTGIGTGTMTPGKVTLIVVVLVTETMTMTMWKGNMSVIGTVKGTEGMTMTRIEDGTSLITARSIPRMNMMTRTMTDIRDEGDIMIMRMHLVVVMMIVIITTWMKITTIRILKLERIIGMNVLYCSDDAQSLLLPNW